MSDASQKRRGIPDMRDDEPTPVPDDDPPPDPFEADLVAYLDGELDPADARRVEARLATDPEARAKATALKKTFDLLDYLPRPEPSPHFTTRTLPQLPAASRAGAPPPPPPARRALGSPPGRAPPPPPPPPPGGPGAGGRPRAGPAFPPAGFLGPRVPAPPLFPAGPAPRQHPGRPADLRPRADRAA